MRPCSGRRPARLSAKLWHGRTASLLATGLLSLTATADECQTYSRIAVSQAHNAAWGVYRTSGAGPAETACPGIDLNHPRWTRDTAPHFIWCQTADVTMRDAESEARRRALLACTAARENLVWNGVDTASCFAGGGPRCMYPPDAYGEGQCHIDGKNTVARNATVKNNRSVLWDWARDDGYFHSSAYHRYGHWIGYQCELRTFANGTREYRLNGLTSTAARERAMTRDPSAFEPPDKQRMKVIDPGPVARP